MSEKLAVVGSGAIASGLAAVAAVHLEDVVLVARSDASAERARTQAAKAIEKAEGDPAHLTVTTDHDALHGRTYVVEAIVEDLHHKGQLLRRLGSELDADTLFASTTSSLSVRDLADASGRPEHFAALHVFNPVPRMKLIEVAFPDAATDDMRARTFALCEALEKTPVEVADSPGFVVNRLLFPYLFDAVRVMEQQGLSATDVDTCMKLGAGMPMGPLALLDFVGLDVSVAIGEELDVDIPATARDLLDDGKLGRKTGQGFHTY